MTKRTLNQHLFDDGPKRILALDGGGIRGILSLQVLRPVEAMVRARTGDPDARLSDYFDLIGGTSTGAIIAAALALGWTIDEIETMYRKLGESIFQSAFFRRGLLRPKFSAKPLRRALEEGFGDVTLGSDRIRTGLAIVAKRLDTGSPWILHNNPEGKYYGPRTGSEAVPNRDYLLREVVRASTAAPTYFEPERFAVTTGQDGAFVDGGVSPHNNPSLQLVLMASLDGYGLRWALGADKLLVTSIGTGSTDLALEPDKVMKMQPVAMAVRALSSIMDDVSALNEVMLQWLSTSPTARRIDSEIGDLGKDVLGGGPAWLTYLRYNAWLDRAWLQAELGLDFPDEQVESIARMDDPGNMDDLVTIGRATARAQVSDDHFPPGFDI